MGEIGNDYIYLLLSSIFLHKTFIDVKLYIIVSLQMHKFSFNKYITPVHVLMGLHKFLLR